MQFIYPKYWDTLTPDQTYPQTWTSILVPFDVI